MTCINNWLTFIELLKQLYKKHNNERIIIENGNLPIIKELVRNDYVICVR
jgi:hypothetical protein